MKKTIKLFSLALMLCLAVFAFAACGGSTENPENVDEKGKTVEQVTTAFEAAGYTVSSETVAGVSSLVAIKGTDTMTVMFFPTKATADSTISTYETTAQALGQTCKQDKSNIYYGTAAAISVYEA